MLLLYCILCCDNQSGTIVANIYVFVNSLIEKIIKKVYFFEILCYFTLSIAFLYQKFSKIYASVLAILFYLYKSILQNFKFYVEIK